MNNEPVYAPLVQVGVNNSGKSYARSRSMTGGLTNGSPLGRPEATRQVTDLARAIFSRSYLRRALLAPQLWGERSTTSPRIGGRGTKEAEQL